TFFDDTFMANENVVLAVVAQILSTGYAQKMIGAVDGVASWSEHKDKAFQLLTMLNTDSDLSNLLRYGIKAVHYELDNGKVKQMDSEKVVPGYLSPANRVIAHPEGIEPEINTEVYREMNASAKMSPIAGF